MIGARLKEERNRLKLTQPEFAAAAGAAKRTLIEWEKGETSPSAVQLSALRGVGVDVLYVLTGEREYLHPETQDQFIARMRAIKNGEDGHEGVAEPVEETPPARTVTYPASGAPVAISVMESPGLSYEQVLALVLDALHAEGRTLPAAKIMAAVDGILAWQRAGIHVTESSVAKQLRQVKA